MTVNLPVPGEEPWGEELNAAILSLDTRLAAVEAGGGGGGGGGTDPTGAWFANKDWYALGTSLTEQNFYTQPLAEMSGMILHNYGASSGSLANGGVSGGNGYIWNKMLTVPADAEIITLETTNDWRLSVVLGTMADAETSGETISFYGALKACFKWLLTNRPAARFFTMTNYPDAFPGGTYGNFYTPNSRGKHIWEYNDAVRQVAEVYGVALIDMARDSGLNYFTMPFYSSDGLHLNTLGGKRFAEFAWSRMRTMDWGTSRPTTPAGETTVNVTSVTIIQGDNLVMAPAQTQQLSVNIAPINATNKQVTWQSSNQAVATVNVAGMITAVAIGSANITATTVDGGKTDVLGLTVSSSVPASGVDLSPAAGTVNVGTTLQLTATVQPGNASNKSVTYSSSAPSKATVNTTGLVTGVALGTSTITATTVQGGYTDTTAITVAATEWMLNSQTTFRGIGLIGLTQGDDSPTYTDVNLPYAAILINTPGHNAIEFAVNNGAKGGGIALGSNGSTSWISIGNISTPLSAFDAKAAFAAGAYSNASPPGVTPAAASAGWGANVIYRVGRVANRVKIVRVDAGVPVTIWDGDLPENYVGHDSKFATVDLGVLAYQTAEFIYTLPINCKTGTWTPP